MTFVPPRSRKVGNQSPNTKKYKILAIAGGVKSPLTAPDMDTDIHFGELEEEDPRVELRPDQNKHFAVEAIDGPIESDLPIFVDLDVMMDMEEHALSDIGVELGGVLLGGQYHDDDGKPFVLVTDSLRATHYESTKGSFKFTHDTWSEITRQMEEFPDDLQMVGWYHTHPDWGVFLSGMDMFICDNFFNKTLDIALVIDPCRDDRGMFMWTGDPAQRVRRTGGFYLTASRFRESELEYLTSQLGVGEMADPRYRTAPHSAGPVVNIADQAPWQGMAVLGMLTMQFFLLLLIALKMLFPTVGWGGDEDRVTKLENQVETLSTARQQEAELTAHSALLDRLAKELGGTQARGETLLKTQQEAQRWESVALGYESRVDNLGDQLKKVSGDLKSMEEKKKKADTINNNLVKQRNGYREDVKTLEARLAKYEKPADGDEEVYQVFGIAWYWAVAGGVAILLFIGGGVAMSMNPDATHEGARDDEDPPRFEGPQFEPDEGGDDGQASSDGVEM